MVLLIKFICGRAGSGKSAQICRQAAASIQFDKPVFLIVPEQMAVETEEKMANLLGNTPSMNLEILNFKRLCNRIFREYGGLSYSYVTNSGKMLLMWRTLSELSGLLNFRLKIDTATVSKMLSAVNEFKTYLISPSMLENAARKAEKNEKRELLSKRLFDLSLIYASYQNLVAETCDDASDDLTKAAELLETNSFFSGADVYFDSFLGFTPQEYKIIEKIIRTADNVSFSLCADLSDDMFENANSTYKYLSELCEKYKKEQKTITLEGNTRTLNPELLFLEKHLWSLDLTEEQAYKNDVSSIAFFECSDLFEECEATAADILKKVQKGASWRDFAVVSRGIERYDGIFDVVFDKYNIPYHISKRTDIKTKPFIKLILTALSLKINNYRCSDVISYMKTGLCGLTPDEEMLIENYALLWNIRGKNRWTSDFKMNPDGYSAEFTDEAKQKLCEINSIRRRLIEPLEAFHSALDSSENTEGCCRALFEYSEAIGIRDKLSALAVKLQESSPDEAQEVYQIFRIFVDSLDEIVTVMGDLEPSIDAFYNLLQIVFDNTDIGKIPTTIDEVILGDASLMRTSAKNIYIIGANEGIFPFVPTDDGVFSDIERDYLKTIGLELSANCEGRAVDERFDFYRAVSSASESLTVVWSSSDLAGHMMKCSFGAARIMSLFPMAAIEKFSSSALDKGVLVKSCISELAAQTRGTALGDAIFRYCQKDKQLMHKLERLDLPLCEENTKLDEKTASEIFAGDLGLTQSRLDTYVLCHLSYFCKYILKLDEHKPAKFDAANIGSFVHHILEVFVSKAKEKGAFCDFSREELDNLVDEIISEYTAAILSSSSKADNGRLNHLFTKLKRSCRLLCKNISSEFSQSKFTPSFFELPIGFENENGNKVKPYQITLSDGSFAYIYGIVDRVDTMEKDGKCYIRVVDYKTGTKEFSIDDIKMGLNTQLLLYLFSIWKNGVISKEDKNLYVGKEILPAGVLYFSASVPTVKAEDELPPEEVESRAEDGLTRQGILLCDEDVLTAMDSELSGKYIPVSRKTNGEFKNTEKLKSIEEFGELLRDVENTIKLIGDSIKSGDASAKPIRNKKHDACAYCEMKPVCRKKQ